MDRIDDALARKAIDWVLIPRKVVSTIDKLLSRHNPSALGNETFSLDLLTGLTMKDLSDTRNVGAGKINVFLQFLDDLIRSESISTIQISTKDSSSEISDTQYDLFAPLLVDFVFSREIIRIYGGTEATAKYLGALRITHPRQLKEWLALKTRKGNLDKYAILHDFHNNLAGHLSNFEPVMEWSVLYNRLLVGKKAWNTFALKEYGFTSKCLHQVFPRVKPNVQAYEAYSVGLTYKEVGDELGVTRQRIQQRIRQVQHMLAEHDSTDLRIHVMKSAEKGTAKRIALNLAIATERELHIWNRIASSPGVSLSMLASEEGRSMREMKSQVPKKLRKFVDGFSDTREVNRTSNDQLLKSVRLAGTFHFPLSGPQFNELVLLGEVPGPGSQTVAKRFGTWKRACELAGVESVSIGREAYETKWSWDEILGFLVEYLLEPQTSGSAQDYEDWRTEQNNEIPSTALVRTEMDTWSKAVSYALIKVGELGPLDTNIYSFPGIEAQSS
jgi:predicted DNA-binding protein YlxM (UPF0122 family)